MFAHCVFNAVMVEVDNSVSNVVLVGDVWDGSLSIGEICWLWRLLVVGIMLIGETVEQQHSVHMISLNYY